MSHPACLPPAPGEAAPAYEAYLAACPAGDVRRLLEEQRIELLEWLGGLDNEAGRLAYAPGKWSVAQLVGHLADGEQLFLERALRAARGDASPQPPWEEDDYAAAWEPRLDLALARLLEQRRLAAAFFAELSEEAWIRPGSVEGRIYSPRVLARVLVGHAAHHLEVFRQRYLPLLPDWRPRRLEAEPVPGLTLRQAELSDLTELLAATRAERTRLGRWMAWAAGGIEEGDTRSFLLAARELWLRRGLPTLTLRAAGSLAGMCGLNPLEGRAAHIGYWLTAAAEGRGLARAASRWLTRHAFEELGLDRVEIRCAVENARSRAVAEALGFRFEGVMRSSQRLSTTLLDLALYAVTAADWPALRDAWEAGELDRRPPRAGACRVLRAAQAEPVMEKPDLRGWRLGAEGERRWIRLRLEPGATVPPHPVPDRALFWVATGEGRLSVDGQDWELQAGDLALVEAGAQRGWQATGGSPLELHVVRGW